MLIASEGGPTSGLDGFRIIKFAANVILNTEAQNRKEFQNVFWSLTYRPESEKPVVWLWKFYAQTQSFVDVSISERLAIVQNNL